MKQQKDTNQDLGYLQEVGRDYYQGCGRVKTQAKGQVWYIGQGATVIVWKHMEKSW